MIFLFRPLGLAEPVRMPLSLVVGELVRILPDLVLTTSLLKLEMVEAMVLESGVVCGSLLECPLPLVLFGTLL